jgi:antitoxin CcdA
MQPLFDTSSPKKPTNLSINSNLLEQARSLGINLSATLEQALTSKVRESKRSKWLEENRDALNACNKLVEENGLFSDKHRSF